MSTFRMSVEGKPDCYTIRSEICYEILRYRLNQSHARKQLIATC